MGSLSADLKTEREKRNIPLAQIAADTRISLHYLESLEEGRYGDLPGGMYNRAFLRAYCESLNLPQQDIMQRYDGEIASPLEKLPKSRVHIPQKSSSLKPNPILVWSLALLISAAGIFFSRSWIAAVFSPYFSRGPAASLPQELEPKSPVLPPPTSKIAADDSTAVQTSAIPDNTAPDSAVATSPPALPLPSQPAAVQAPGDPGSTLPPLQSSLQLEVGATEPCWVSVEQDSSRSFRKLMAPGEVQHLYAAEQFFIIVGNAGGIRLKINGKPAKALGKPGEVVKILINEKNIQDYLDQTPG